MKYVILFLELDNTIVIYTSDQGMMLGEQTLVSNHLHSRWYEEGPKRGPGTRRFDPNGVTYSSPG